MKSIDENKFFIIEQRKWTYPNDHFKYAIMKNESYDLTTATKMILDNELPFISIESWGCVHEDGQEFEQII